MKSDKPYYILDNEDTLVIYKYRLRENSTNHSIYTYVNHSRENNAYIGYEIILNVNEFGVDIIQAKDIHMLNVPTKDDNFGDYRNYKVEISNNLSDIYKRVEKLYDVKVSEDVKKHFIVQELLD